MGAASVSTDSGCGQQEKRFSRCGGTEPVPLPAATGNGQTLMEEVAAFAAASATRSALPTENAAAESLRVAAAGASEAGAAENASTLEVEPSAAGGLWIPSGSTITLVGLDFICRRGRTHPSGEPRPQKSESADS